MKECRERPRNLRLQTGATGPTGSANAAPGTIIELVAGSPAPAGYRLLFRGVDKFNSGGGQNGNGNGGGQTRLLVDIYVKQ